MTRLLLMTKWLGVSFLLLTAFRLCAAELPRAGDEVDISAFAHSRNWDGSAGFEWDEPREVWRVEADFSGAASVPADGTVHVEYWISNWPPVAGGGWTKTDTPWQGSWRRIAARREVRGHTLIFRFEPLSEAENPNAKNTPGIRPSFRKTLKLRLHLAAAAIPVSRIRVYSRSRWNTREVTIQSGCEDHRPVAIAATAYNGLVIGSKPLHSRPAGVRLTVLYTEHDPGSDDRTILTIQGPKYPFGVSVDDVIQRGAVYVKPLGVLIGDAIAGKDYVWFMQSGTIHSREDIISRTTDHADQSLTNAIGEIPRLSVIGRSSNHPIRYVPLGFPADREKYGLDFNGNIFISKAGAKAMKEDLARMLWEGDEIYFRIGTGHVPDFRQRPESARQEVLDGYIPLVTTRWNNDGIDYEEQAYATLLEDPLDDARLRGDEPSVLLLRLRARNPGPEARQTNVWFHLSPAERFRLKDTLLFATGDKDGPYPHARVRAALHPAGGSLEFRDVPPLREFPLDAVSRRNSGRPVPALIPQGAAAVWSVPLPALGTQTLDIAIPFRSVFSPADEIMLKSIRFDQRLEETLDYWKRRITSAGTQIRVPDEMINSFYLSALQHILVSEQRDVNKGYTMCPCGTYDYNMFANETNIQVRFLDMRGLHDEAWRCLRPIIELQGSKPFPGRFKDTSAEFHGVRVDAEHDYTHGGYNLNHGWTLWTLAEHYFFTRDEKWLRAITPRMIRAADWIVDERKATMQRDSAGERVPEYGLLPAGELEDNEDWEYWFAVNGYAYRGLNAAAEAISAVDRTGGARLKAEAAAYREDIRRAAFHAMSIVPAVPLRDGTFVPNLAPRTSLHGRDLGWIRNVLYGAHTLVDCGVFDTDEPATTWILQDYEDNLFMAPDSLSVPDRDWFSRGGVALQPNLVNLFVTYLERDQIPQALRSFYNDFAISYYPDVNAFTEWVPTLGIGGGPFFKTSDEAAFLTWLRLMLVRESGDRLDLDFGSPRDWFLPGRIIEVSRAATFFGELSFGIESHIERGFMEAHVAPPRRSPPRTILLRLRHPGGKRMARVELNGAKWTDFSAQQETVTIPADREVQLRAFYQ